MIARVLLFVRDRLAVHWHRAHRARDRRAVLRLERWIDALDDFARRSA